MAEIGEVRLSDEKINKNKYLRYKLTQIPITDHSSVGRRLNYALLLAFNDDDFSIICIHTVPGLGF